jgi:hypothetical protein
MPRQFLHVAAPALALVLALAGCRSDGADPAGGPTPDQTGIRSGLASLFAGDHPGTRETTEGECFAKRLTEAVSPQELRSAGVLDASYDVVAQTPPLPAEVAGDWADAQLACADFVEASARAQVKVTKGDIDAEAYSGCLRGELTDEQIRAAVTASLMGDFDAAAVGDLSAAQASCARSAGPR